MTYIRAVNEISTPRKKIVDFVWPAAELCENPISVSIFAAITKLSAAAETRGALRAGRCRLGRGRPVGIGFDSKGSAEYCDSGEGGNQYGGLCAHRPREFRNGRTEATRQRIATCCSLANLSPMLHREATGKNVRHVAGLSNSHRLH